ncbi:MAG: ribosome biogenesis GTPase YlqF [Clostridia bacterium]|nr:ribosome biogenesis GTPase YlqF [Clostridia bacterium]
MVDIVNKGDTRKNLKWFPGHMKSALEDIEDNKIKLADVILYVLDARAPFSCMNPNVNKIVHNKPIIYVFNKMDLADDRRVAEIQKEFIESGKTTILVSSNNATFKNAVKTALKTVLKEKIERHKEKQMTATYKVLVLGVPNTGKSTLINMLAGVRKATTGNIAGVTRVNQWIKIDDMFMLLDTPGVLWPKFDDGLSRNLAYVGSLSDKEFDMTDLGFELMQILFEKYPNIIKEKYDVDFDFEEFIELYDRICLKRGFIMRGNEIDYERAGRTFITEFRNGKFGKITLE